MWFTLLSALTWDATAARPHTAWHREAHSAGTQGSAPRQQQEKEHLRQLQIGTVALQPEGRAERRAGQPQLPRQLCRLAVKVVGAGNAYRLHGQEANVG